MKIMLFLRVFFFFFFSIRPSPRKWHYCFNFIDLGGDENSMQIFIHLVLLEIFAWRLADFKGNFENEETMPF